MAPKSFIWKYFNKISKEQAGCNLCSKNLKTSGNTTNIKNHLKQKHDFVYRQQCEDSASNKEETPEKPKKRSVSPVKQAGKRKEYNIGKELRSRYYDFLAINFTLDTVDARCTDYNRTKMSLQLVLASLFPPRGDLVWENRLDWQPVPFNYWPVHEDHVLADPLKNCPRYNKLFWDYLNSAEGRQLFDNYTDVIGHIESHTGQTMNSKLFADLYFTLTTEKENGYDHPQWTTDIYHHIQELAINDYNVSTATPELKKFVVGFLVKKIIDDSLSKMKGEYYKDTKIFLYSAHEFNVAVLLRFFDVFYSHVPPYGSYVIVEIHNVNGISGVKLFYQDYTSENPKRLKIPGCGNFCKLKKFVKLYQDMLPESEKECFRLDDV